MAEESDGDGDGDGDGDDDGDGDGDGDGDDDDDDGDGDGDGDGFRLPIPFASRFHNWNTNSVKSNIPSLFGIGPNFTISIPFLADMSRTTIFIMNYSHMSSQIALETILFATTTTSDGTITCRWSIGIRECPGLTVTGDGDGRRWRWRW